MIVWILYDIQSDKARGKVAKACLQAGLYRVQYSVFLGTIEKSEKDALALRIEDLINKEKDKCYIFPMSKDELKQTVLLGQAFDEKIVSEQVYNLFL